MKQQETFTPGPWEVYGCEQGEKYGQVFSPDGVTDGRTICNVAESELIPGGRKARFAHNAEDEANARLIAAAPELYEQCKRFEKVLSELVVMGEADIRDRDKLRGLLAKVVEGEERR